MCQSAILHLETRLTISNVEENPVLGGYSCIVSRGTPKLRWAIDTYPDKAQD